jgi:diguanylate cyclase (GGDEF)-like protein/PAS domain S-box-containing protein
LTGYEIDEIRGQNPRLLASGRTPRETYQALWAGLSQSGYWQGELWDRRKDGHIYPKWAAISVIRDINGNLTHHIASFTDMSERKATEERIDYLAHHDVLTGLLNRFNLENRLEQTLLFAHRNCIQVAVMFIDMDRFKLINDTLGHHVGDLMLIEVARRLKECVRESDIVARLGGDEFVVVLTGMIAAFDAAPIASKILRSLGDAYLIEGNILHSSPSIGISIFPNDGFDSQALMKAADTAMYHAKEQGRNNVQFFTAAMNESAGQRMALERELRQALECGQFELHYQPQVCAEDGRTCAVEALIRWNHPQQGLISPLKFIPIAEESGMIEEIGLWVLNEACRQLVAWRDEGLPAIRMAVNISAHQLRSSGLVNAVQTALERYQLRGSDLELEVTESVAMKDPERAIGQLHALEKLGIRLAIDDFGTGYSSLAYLKQLPIHCLKLDRTFVSDIETDSNDASISTATLALAHSLNLQVVAEGVETEGQMNFLKQHSCDFLQGYYLGRPEPGKIWSTRWKENPETLKAL